MRISHQRVRSLLNREALDGEAARELAFHFDQLVEEHIVSGAGRDDARRLARQALGNVIALKEECRDQRRANWLHDLWQDFVYAFRILRKSPAFTFVATVSLAIGIGANAATLSVINRVLMTALPFPEPERLVMLRTVPPSNPGQIGPASRTDFMAWREQARSFESVGASIANQRYFSGEGQGAETERINGRLFTPSLFGVLGVQPQLGRVFTVEDARTNARSPVIVISHRLWQRRFGGDPQVLQRPVRVSGVPTTVLGVMPPGFNYPNDDVDFWAPFIIGLGNAQGSARLFAVTARLKPGVTIEQAQAELDAVAARLAAELPDLHRGWGARIQSLHDAQYGWAKPPLLTLEAAVALLLLIACVNIAGLLCARGAVRTREIAVRSALGAGRGRIVRQLFAESLVLSLGGAALGILVAAAVLMSLARLVPPPAGWPIAEMGVDLRVVMIAGLLAIVTTAVFGAVPAVISTRRDLRTWFSGPERGRVTSSQHTPLWGAHSTAQIALALIILIGVGLVGRSFYRLAGRDLNFEPDNLLTFDVVVPIRDYARQIGSYEDYPYFEVTQPPWIALERVYEKLRALPGVESVGGLSFPHVNSFVLAQTDVTLDPPSLGGYGAAGSALRTTYFHATPNLFTTLRATIVRGRDFTIDDTPSSPWVVILNETAARRFWPDADPIGRHLRLSTVPEDLPRQVIGVVKDIPLRRTDTQAEPVIYISYLQQPARFRSPLPNLPGRLTYLVRGSGDLSSLAVAIRRAVADMDPERTSGAVIPVVNQVVHPLPQRGYYLLVLVAFAMTATLLAAIGVYGVTSYAVAQQTREIGIRIAMGARSRDVITLFGRRAMVTIGAGLVLGLAGALAVTRLIESQLWNVTPTDPATFGAVSILLTSIALLACWFPLRRALRVDPTIALKCE